MCGRDNRVVSPAAESRRWWIISCPLSNENLTTHFMKRGEEVISNQFDPPRGRTYNLRLVPEGRKVIYTILRVVRSLDG